MKVTRNEDVWQYMTVASDDVEALAAALNAGWFPVEIEPAPRLGTPPLKHLRRRRTMTVEQQFPFRIPELDCWVYHEPALRDRGEVRYRDDGEPYIVLRTYDERVLLHECLHVALSRQRKARELLGFDEEEALVRKITRVLYAMGWRWRVSDRELAAAEAEVNEVAEQRDAAVAELRALAERFGSEVRLDLRIHYDDGEASIGGVELGAEPVRVPFAAGPIDYIEIRRHVPGTLAQRWRPAKVV